MSSQCPAWEKVKDLPPKQLASFLRDNDEELLWYLQKLHSQDKTIQKENSHLKKLNNNLQEKYKAEISDMLKTLANIDYTSEKSFQDTEKCKEIRSHLEQEVLILKEIVTELEKEKTELP